MSNSPAFKSWLSNRNDTKNLIRDAMDEIYNDSCARNHVKNIKCIREYVNNTKRISLEEVEMFYGFIVDYYEELRMKEYYIAASPITDNKNEETKNARKESEDETVIDTINFLISQGNFNQKQFDGIGRDICSLRNDMTAALKLLNERVDILARHSSIDADQAIRRESNTHQ
jgi:hypothetical protein